MFIELAIDSVLPMSMSRSLSLQFRHPYAGTKSTGKAPPVLLLSSRSTRARHLCHMQAHEGPDGSPGRRDGIQVESALDLRSETGQDLTGGEATRLDSHLSRHTYHGHRRKSFVTKDIDELTELRARRKLLFSLSATSLQPTASN